MMAERNTLEMSLADAISFHQLLLTAEGVSSRTAKMNLHYERMFLDWLERNGHPLTIDELRVERVNEFLVWYRNQPLGIATRGGEVAVFTAAENLKRLGGVLEANDYVSTNPLRKLKLPKTTKWSRVPFSVQEINAMWGACFRTQNPVRDEAIFLMLLDTGMRRS